MFEHLADDINHMFNETTVEQSDNHTITVNPRPLDVLNKPSSIAIMVATGLLLIFVFFLIGFCMKKRYPSRRRVVRDIESAWPGRNLKKQGKMLAAVLPNNVK